MTSDQILSGLQGIIGLLVIVLAAWLGLRVVRLGRTRLQRRIDREIDPDDQPGRQRRLSTILSVGAHSLKVVIVAMALISLLAKLGINVTPLLTSLGVVGLALSLGAQMLIKDYISGLIMLIEDQYAVGETVTISGLTGEVERISMRATWLRGEDGTMHSVPHGDVRSVTNISRDWNQTNLVFNLAEHADPDAAVMEAESAVCHAVEEPVISAALLGVPRVQVWKDKKNIPAQIRVSVRTRTQAVNNYVVEQTVKRAVQDALEQASLLRKRDLNG